MLLLAGDGQQGYNVPQGTVMSKPGEAQGIRFNPGPPDMKHPHFQQQAPIGKILNSHDFEAMKELLNLDWF